MVLFSDVIHKTIKLICMLVHNYTYGKFTMKIENAIIRVTIYLI